ncbi:NAD(P)/FAD-dependent oxidoreductase [Desulforamulus hydrothermalis]|uniref:NAD(P)/FAD-dependent oxidoreductase n=1 Tax=Desulforamulus hydrothermalis TaxID=412895 RepID=UPI00091A1D26|nr:NAD(P)/FAD-dependent oxidoreductase [Desulforamulus hydrothermalis]SHG99062.1 hypothetical protein SAMN02745177_01046 [Desulforamulus hydrothermalis Lam5 = DSM 18033]
MQENGVIVIGGGPAGMMAAARAAALGVQVCLLEKNDCLGKKMLITGGGRCNLTNDTDIQTVIANIPGNGKFVYSALHRFTPQDLRHFLLKLGVPTKVEDQGRVFPVSDRAGQVVQALEQYLRQQGVTVRYKSQVDGLLVKDRRCLGVQAGSHTFRAGAVVLATGGMSYPHTGSTGEGYAMARRWGHNITELFPAAVAVTCNDAWITERQVQGVSLSGVKIVLYNSGGKVMAAEQGDVIFTHWGLSGPAALRLGRAVALAQQRQPGVMLKGEMDILPDQSPDLLAKRLLQRVQEGDRRSLKNLLADWLPERLARVLVKLADISPDATWGQVDKGACQRLLALVKKLPLQITGTRPLAEATVTGGGINIKEIDPRTMGSRLIKGLFLAGEVLDVDAHTGGYNMQVAFSTGYVAGESAAACCKETLDERNTFM